VWLVRTNERWLAAFWRHISQPFAKAALTKLRGTSAKLNRVICTEGRKAKLHCPIMFIAERQNVRAHWSSLASMKTLAVLLAGSKRGVTHQLDVPGAWGTNRPPYGNPQALALRPIHVIIRGMCALLDRPAKSSVVVDYTRSNGARRFGIPPLHYGQELLRTLPPTELRRRGYFSMSK
jgi:hypothetical protein